MPKLRQQSIDKTMYDFYCPGCKDIHTIQLADGHWTLTGDLDKPTVNPSILVRSGHFAPHFIGNCWCTYKEENPDDKIKFSCTNCHSFIRSGKIEFLSDCSHELAGKTIELQEIEQ